MSALLEVWREIYARYPNIRAKIFLRKDIYEGEVNYVTDKVKFHNHLSEISWEYDQLLNIIWKRLRYKFSESNSLSRWIMDIPTENLGPILGELPSANEHQNRAILTQLLGEYMGGNNKAFPYNWILYHVSDTKRRIQPRSLLNLFSETANQQLGAQEEPNHDGTLFTPKYMELANQMVSRRRVEDIKEEYPTLSPVFSSLSSYLTQFPVAESQLDEALAKLRIGNMEIQDIKKKLEDIGVLYEYKFNRKGVERRYHIPDLYLIGMGLKRKGPGAHKALFGKK